jgi:hypothetical protein
LSVGWPVVGGGFDADCLGAAGFGHLSRSSALLFPVSGAMRAPLFCRARAFA